MTRRKDSPAHVWVPADGEIRLKGKPNDLACVRTNCTRVWRPGQTEKEQGPCKGELFPAER